MAALGAASLAILAGLVGCQVTPGSSKAADSPANASQYYGNN